MARLSDSIHCLGSHEQMVEKKVLKLNIYDEKNWYFKYFSKSCIFSFNIFPFFQIDDPEALVRKDKVKTLIIC